MVARKVFLKPENKTLPSPVQLDFNHLTRGYGTEQAQCVSMRTLKRMQMRTFKTNVFFSSAREFTYEQLSTIVDWRVAVDIWWLFFSWRSFRLSSVLLWGWIPCPLEITAFDGVIHPCALTRTASFLLRWSDARTIVSQVPFVTKQSRLFRTLFRAFIWIFKIVSAPTLTIEFVCCDSQHMHGERCLPKSVAFAQRRTRVAAAKGHRWGNRTRINV